MDIFVQYQGFLTKNWYVLKWYLLHVSTPFHAKDSCIYASNREGGSHHCDLKLGTLVPIIVFTEEKY